MDSTEQQIAKAYRALTARKITADEFRATMRALREQTGDDDQFEVAKGHGMAIAYNGRA